MTRPIQRIFRVGTILAAFLVIVIPASAQNVVLVEDDFEGVAVGAVPDPALWTNRGGLGFMSVVDNGTSPFGSPNQYLDWNDNQSSSSSVRLQCANFTELAGVISTYAFDFVEPSGEGSGQLLFGYSITGGDLNTAGQVVRLRLDDGALSSQQGFNETGTTTYNLDQVYRVYVLFNDSAGDVANYFDGQTLDAGDVDVWLVPEGGSPVFAGASDRVAATPARIGLRTFNSTVQRAYIDNIVLETGLGGPFGQALPPGIVTSPRSQDVVLGTTQTVFTVVANGAAPLAYQWSRDGTPMPGETNGTLVIDQPRLADEADYTVVVTNDLGSATSDPGTLRIVAAPIDPPVQVALDGTTAALSIAMPAGSTGYLYQWRLDGGDLAGETGDSLVIASATSADAGAYTVSVTLDGDTVLSGEAQLLVAPPATAAYSATVLADGPVAYWRLGEMAGTGAAADIAGAAGGPFNGTYGTGVALEQTGAILGDADAAAGFTGTETSKVEVAFAEALNPLGAFSVEAWALVEGGQGSERNVVTSFDAFDSLAENYGYEITATAQDRWRFTTGRGITGTTLNQTDLDGPAVIPLEWTYLVGTYDGSTFTWYVNGAPWATATEAYEPMGSFLSQPLFIGAGGVDDIDGIGDSFFQGLIDEVAVYASALSQAQVLAHFAAGLPTDAEPRITVQPNNQQRDVSGQVAFAVGVRSGGEPSYQWQKDGTDIGGATGDTLELADLDLSDAGDYRVLVTVGANVVTSEVASLTIRPPSTVLIDDFETYTTGLVENVASPAWVVNLNGFYTVEEETSGGNKFLRALDDNGSGTAPTLVSFGDTNVSATATNAVPDNGISTLFLRFYVEETTDGSLWFGATDAQTGGFNAFEGYVNTTLPTGFTIRDGGAFFPAVSNLVLGTWYHLWLVEDNDTDTLQVYLTTENRDATLGDRLERENGQFAFGFRNGTTAPLTHFQLISRTVTGGHRIDDLYISTGVNLTNPVAAPSLGPVGISLQGGLPEVTWTDTGTLQQSQDLTGPWSNVTEAVTSPYVPSGDAPVEHYRLQQ